MLVKKGQLYETTRRYQAAIETLKDAKLEGLNNGFIDYVKGEIARIKKKVKPKKIKKKKKNQTKKKKVKLFFGLI